MKKEKREIEGAQAASRVEKLSKRFPTFGKEEKNHSRHIELLRTAKFPKSSRLLSKEKPLKGMRAQALSVETKEKELSVAGWSHAALAAHRCCVSQKHPGFVFLERILIKPADLAHKQLHVWKMKGDALARRKIGREAETPADNQKRIITRMQEENQESTDTANDLWQEMLQTKEERLFRVGRVDKT